MSRRRPGSASGFLPLGFGTKMFDFDNDGDLDIHVTNGHVIDNVKLYQPNLTYEQKDLLYENVGRKLQRCLGARAGRRCRSPRVGRGLAVADFDNDGKLDVAISASGRRPVLLRNQGARRRQLAHDSREGTEEQSLRSGRDGSRCRRRAACRSARSTTSPAT